MRRIAMIAISIAEAIRNRMPAKVNGGRSVRPTLMNSQVEPQMPQSRSQTRRDFIHYLLYVRPRDWSISLLGGFGVLSSKLTTRTFSNAYNETSVSVNFELRVSEFRAQSC